MSRQNLRFAMVVMLGISFFGAAMPLAAQDLRPSTPNQSKLKEPRRHSIPAELSPANIINQRYQEMLQQNRARSESPIQSQVYPGSYNISGTHKSYVNKQLPSRLIPPGRDGIAQSPYKLNPESKSVAPNRGTTTKLESVQPQTLPPTNLRIDGLPARRGTERFLPPIRQARQPSGAKGPTPPHQRQSLPPIVKPRRSDVQSWPRSRNTTFRKPGQQEVIQTSQATQLNEHPQSSLIPTSVDDSSKVTRARFVMVQETADPFGQQPRNQDQDFGNDRKQDDPFADPEADNRPGNQTGDPFADPPEDVGQQNVQDPFADPPEDAQDDTRLNDPFGDQDNNFRSADPFPDNPQDIPPADPRNLPDENNGPNNTTNDDEAVRRTEQGEPILGPFKPRRGFSPKPILPSPPEREFPNSVTQVIPSFQDSVEFFDQPTFFGPSFDKSQLYEGITQAPVATTQYCENTPCETVPFARPGMLSRICKNMQCQTPNCSGCTVPGNNPVWNRAYGQSNTWDESACQTGNCMGDIHSCHAPLFYFSVFGGYTQLEPMGPFGIPMSIIADGPLATVFSNDGFGVGTSVGQYHGPNLRTELEFSYRSNDADSVFQSAFTDTTQIVDGSVRSFSGMFNLLWDFRYRPWFGWYQPYAGGGVGFTFVDINLPENSFIEDNQNQSSFAYQLIGGISRPLASQMEGFVEYRYLNADPIRILALSASGSADYSTENIFFGIRMQF